MVQQDTGVSIDIWPWVLDFTELLEDWRNDLIYSLAEIDEFVVLDVFNGEFSLVDVSGISVSEDGVTVSWNNLSGGQGSVGEFSDLFVGDVASEFLLKVQQPSQDFLIGQTVEWASKTVEGSRVREIRISQSRSDQVGSVGRDVTTFVITVDGEVTSEAFLDFVLLITQHVSEVSSPVEVWVSGNDITTLVEVSVDQSGDSWHLGNEVDTILVDWVPVLGFMDTLSVSLGEFTVGLEVEEGSRQLSHWVHVVWEVLNEELSVVWDGGSGSKFIGDGSELSLAWELTSHQKPQKTFWQWFTSIGGLWKSGDEVRDGVSSESDTLGWVEEGGIPEHGEHISHTAQSLVDSDVTNDGLGILFLDFLKLSLLFRDDFLESLLQGDRESLGLSVRNGFVEESG